MARAGSELLGEALGVRPPGEVEERQGELAKRPDLLRLEVAVDEHDPLEAREQISVTSARSVSSPIETPPGKSAP